MMEGLIRVLGSAFTGGFQQLTVQQPVVDGNHDFYHCWNKALLDWFVGLQTCDLVRLEPAPAAGSSGAELMVGQFGAMVHRGLHSTVHSTHVYRAALA